MAEQGFILDIDAKFLKNLEQADKALSKSVGNANQMTDAFKGTVLGSSQFASQVKSLVEQMNKLGGLKIDGSGIASIDTAAMSATDKINLLIDNMSKFKSAISAMKGSGQDTWLSPNQLFSAPDLRTAIADIQDIMKSDKTLKLVDQQSLTNEVETYKAALKELSKSDEQRIKEHADLLAKGLKNVQKAYKAEVSEAQKRESSLERAMSASDKTTSQRINKIAKLRRVEQELVQDEAKYKDKIEEVRRAIDSLSNSNEDAGESAQELNENQKPLINTAEQLKRAFALTFSVSAIRGYVNQMVKVRGEFELQQRALQAIIGNRERADAIWEKTVALAVRSPFQVKELVTYTKQLAAYRIESDKLYDTNKMLADISAGLGVEMGRLILAFGQVKAANYLRGTELRQFSEAGINVLGELADYYTELEGRIVGVGEVFERVSRRMVTFSDVETVLQRMTSKGGLFYNMQEIQAETLKGQISNLKDSLDLMFNEIGKDNEELLKGGVAVTRVVLDNWRVISTVMQSAISIYALLTAARLKDAFVTGAWTSANIAATASTRGLVGGIAQIISLFKTLSAWAVANPLTAVAAVLAAVGTVIFKYVDRQRELNKAYDESVGKIVANSNASSNYSKVLIDLAKKQEELLDANKELNKESEEYKENQSSIIRIENERKEILSELSKTSPEFVQQIKNIATKTSELSAFAEEYNQKLRARLALEAKLNGDRGIDTTEYNEALSSKSSIVGRLEAQRGLMEKRALDLMGSKSIMLDEKAILKEFLESTEPFYKRVLKLREEVLLLKNRTTMKVSIDDLYRHSGIGNLAMALNNISKAEKSFVSLIKTEALDFRESQDYGKSLFSTLSSATATDEEKSRAKNNLIDYYESVLDDKGVTGELREKAKEVYVDIFSLDSWTKDVGLDLLPWQKEFNAELNSLASEEGIRGISEITDNATQVSDQLSHVEQALTEYKEAVYIYKNVAGQKIVDKKSFEEAESVIPMLEKLRTLLGGYDKNNDGSFSKEDRTLANRIRLVKALHEEYNKLRKSMDSQEAASEVYRAYRDPFSSAFSGTDIEINDYFKTIQGVVAMLHNLEPEAEREGREAQLTLKREIGDINVRLNLDSKEADDKRFAQQISDLFSGYEISIELEKLNIPKSFASQFFGLEALDLFGIADFLESEKAKAGPDGEGVSRDRLELIEAAERKLTELEAKEQQERLNKYLGYARNAIGERAKIKLEEMRKLQEIELTFAPKEGETEDARMRREATKQSAIEGVQREATQATKKLDWEEFQKTDTFISIFQDLDNASEALLQHAIDKLKEFKDSWKDMPHEEMKSIVQNIAKLEDQLVAMKNPFQAYRDLREELKSMRSTDEIQLDTMYQEEAIASLNQEIAITEQILSLREEGRDLEADELSFASDRADLFGLNTKQTKDILDAQKQGVSVAQDMISKNNKDLSTKERAKKLLLAQAEALQKSQKMANDLYDAFKDLADVLGGSDSTVAIFADMGMSIANSVLDCLALQVQVQATKLALGDATVAAGAFGAAMNTAMGIVGWIVMGVQVLTSVLKAAFAAHDKGLEKQIGRIQERVEALQEQFEKLEEAMDRAFSLDQVSRYSEEAKKNMESQIRSYQDMIALEEDKKKTDHEKIKEWEEAMKDVQEQYDELTEDGFNLVTGDILSDVMGAARDFVDAWHDAFLETGDGLSGLEQNFTDMFKEIMRQQAAMSIVGPYIEQFQDQLKNFVDVKGGDTTLTTEEAREWAEMVKGTFPEISALLQSFFEGTQDLMQEQGELSELSKGIQGVTESTAQVLEALLNSMRFYVADSNMRLQNIEAAFASDEVSRNPILNELRQQTQMIRSIESMFDSVIGRGGSSHVGGYIKVKID